ncbi:RidA family protein [Nitratireductor pacificus]|uniref:Endoribonuclease L-PSP n=1 Tax=Nitratireductor pacificus pht-3B TaxID=391937 RepID=K2N225_9HYPH|nr:RidA family protein [Nitratireductor pacificus]EKF18288.1 endoribonuclease L-PSP [Nitratireductor pacificus pht-3B]
MTAAHSIEKRLAEMGLSLPLVSESKGNYRSYKIEGSLLFVSGQLCVGPDGAIAEGHKGKIGSKITESEGYAAAQLCLLQVLAHARLALGSLDRLRQCVRLGGFVNAEPDLLTPGAAMNGASDMIVEIMGESGKHSRTTIGVATLPLGACIEVEGVFAFD